MFKYPADHPVSGMQMDDGRIVGRIPTYLCHAYLGVSPTDVSWPVLGRLSRERGWCGPRSLYIKPAQSQHFVRGFKREVS